MRLAVKLSNVQLQLPEGELSMQVGAFPAQMSGGSGELYGSYSAVETRREWEIGLIKEKLARNEDVDLPVCRVERVGA